MKKIISMVICVAMLAMIMPAVYAQTVDTQVLYQQTFETAEGIKDFTRFQGSSSMTYNDDGSVSLSKHGTNNYWALSDEICSADFIFEADVTSLNDGSETLPNASLVFNNRATTDFTSMKFYPLTGNIVKVERVDSVESTVYAENHRGFSELTAKDQTRHFVLTVKDGYLKFAIDGELVFTFSNDVYKTGGGFGIGVQGGSFKFDNIIIKKYTSNYPVYYSNAFIDKKRGADLTKKTTAGGNFINGDYGDAMLEANGNQSIWVDDSVELSGDYSYNLNFALLTPTSATRWAGIVYGYKEAQDGTASYGRVGIRQNGQGFVDGKKSGKNFDVLSITDEERKDETGLKYATRVTEGENTVNVYDYTMRHNLRVDVINNVASVYFDGSFIQSVEYDNIDGKIGISGGGCGLVIFSMEANPILTELGEEYYNDFSSSDAIADWERVAGTATPTVSNGRLTWSSANETHYLLPVASRTDFVLEADVTHYAGDNRFGIIFGYKDSTDYDAMWIMRSNDVTGSRLRYTGDSTDQWTAGSYGGGYLLETAHKNVQFSSFKYKVVVNNNRLYTFVDNQLAYTHDLTNYSGGKIGFGSAYFGCLIDNVRVSKINNVNKVYYGESFNDSSITSGIVKYNSTTEGISIAANGIADWGKAGGTGIWYKPDTVVGDHHAELGFRFENDTNGATRFLGPVFGAGIADGAITGYNVSVCRHGEVRLQKFSAAQTDTGLTETKTLKTTKASDILKLFPEGLEEIEETTVLPSTKYIQYSHTLKDGKLEVYLDGYKVMTYESDDLKNASGLVGLHQNGNKNTLAYYSITGVEYEDYDYGCKGTLTFDYGTAKTAQAYKKAEIYDADGNLITTMLSDADGSFYKKLRNYNTTYTARVYTNGEQYKEVQFTPSIGSAYSIVIPITNISGESVTIGNEKTQAVITLNDTEELISDSGIVILAVYNGSTLVGTAVSEITAENLTADMTVEYEETDASLINVKAFVLTNSYIPVCEAAEL